MVTVKGVFDKLGVPQSNHVRSYIGMLASDEARNRQIEYTRIVQQGTDEEEGTSYSVNAYPDSFEPIIVGLILDQPKKKRPRIKIKKSTN